MVGFGALRSSEGAGVSTTVGKGVGDGDGSGVSSIGELVGGARVSTTDGGSDGIISKGLSVGTGVSIVVGAVVGRSVSIIGGGVGNISIINGLGVGAGVSSLIAGQNSGRALST